jgi:hypothetical protein
MCGCSSARAAISDRAGGPPVVRDANPEALVQRHGLIGDAEQAAVDRIEAVGDVGEQQGRLAPQQAGERVGQHLVRAIADEHLVRIDAVVGGQRLEQLQRHGVGIEPERLGRRRPDGLDRHGRGAERALVGVQLDQAGDARLLARHIGLQTVGQGAPEAAHRCPVGQRGGAMVCADRQVKPPAQSLIGFSSS